MVFDELLSTSFSGSRMLFWEGAASVRVEREFVMLPADLQAIVGPEGGFDLAEVTAARASGVHIVGLGPRVLRAETAAIAVVALCQHLWGDL
jgi:16S rRNA (uracil1498-N3)-methyltransferase